MGIVILVGWAVTGFLIVLFTPIILIFGGLLLGTVLIPGALLMVPVLMVVAARQRGAERVRVAGAAGTLTSIPRTVELPSMPSLVPVLATAEKVQGVCPLGSSIVAGQTWTLNGAWSGDGPCPQAVKFLSRKAELVRSGAAQEGELWECTSHNHDILFRLTRASK